MLQNNSAKSDVKTFNNKDEQASVAVIHAAKTSTTKCVHQTENGWCKKTQRICGLKSLINN